MKYSEFKKTANSYKNQDWFRGTRGGNQGLMTDAEAARRFSSVPVSGSGLFGSSYANADKSIVDTANQYKQYLKWRMDNKKNLPDNFNYQTYQSNNKTYGMLDLPSVPKAPQVDATALPQQQPQLPEPQVKQQPTNQPTQQQASNNIFDKNTFNNDRINNIKDPEQLDAYMDFVLKGGFGARQLQDTDYDLSKMTIADIANNPNAISGLSDALENSSQEARESFLRVTKQYQEAVNNKGGDATNSGNGNATTSTSGAGSMSQENMDKIKGSFLKGAWNDIKKDPIGMLPQIASMFLKYIGAGDGIANFFKNPWGFYGTLATLLLGGGMLLSGGSDDDDKPVVNNYYNQPAGYNRIPYM